MISNIIIAIICFISSVFVSGFIKNTIEYTNEAEAMDSYLADWNFLNKGE